MQQTVRWYTKITGGIYEYANTIYRIKNAPNFWEVSDSYPNEIYGDEVNARVCEFFFEKNKEIVQIRHAKLKTNVITTLKKLFIGW